MTRKLSRRDFVRSAVAATAVGTAAGKSDAAPPIREAQAPTPVGLGPALIVMPERTPYTSETEGRLLVTAVGVGPGELSLTLTQAGQVISTLRPVEPSRRVAVPLPLTTLPEGDTHIICQLSRGRQVLASADAVVTRLPPKANEVKIDNGSRGLIVDGLPFLAFGFFCWFPTGDLADQEATQGFNLMAPYQSLAVGHTPDEMTAIRASLDRAAAVGMKVHYDLRKVATLPSSPQKLALIRAEVEAFRDHPAVLCWYIADEPSGEGIPPPPLQESYRFIKGLDPYHPITIVLNDPEAAPRYASAMDILMADPYPIPNHPVTLVGAWTDRLSQAVNGRLPVWIVPQAFGGGEWWKREPSTREERVMTYLALIHGARGIQYFVRRPPIGNPKSPALWGECRSLALEAAELTSALLSPEARPSVTAAPASVHAATWQDRGLITILAVNTLNHPDTLTLQLASRTTGMANVLFEDRQLEIRNGLITEMIDAYGTRVYTVPIGPQPPEDLTLNPNNLAVNPSFEEFANPGTPAGFYFSVGKDAAASAFLDSRIARHGRHSLRVTTPQDGQGLSLEPYPVPLKANTSYRVSIWARGRTAGLIFELSLGPVGTKQFTLSTDWAEYSFTGPAPRNVSKAYLGLRLISAGTAWFDVLQVVKDSP